MRIAPQHSASGTNSMLNFFTGALDVAYMGSSPLVLGHLYSLPMQLMSVACVHTGSQAVLTRRGAPASASPRLGTVLGSDGHVLAHFFAQESGFKRPAYINLSPTECIGALTSGMLDYTALWEPYVSLAVEAGAQIVYTDNDLPFNLYGFLVATERAAEDKYELVENMRQVHESALGILRSEPGRYVDRLRMVFGSEVSARTYEKLLAEGYRWDSVDMLNGGELPEEVADSLDSVWKAHEELQATNFAEHPLSSLVQRRPKRGETDRNAILLLGYSNSIMCSSFHVADYAKLFQDRGFEVQTGRRRIEDRIARLDISTQDDLRLCYELLRRDPELVVQKLGHMNEQLFRGLSRDLLGVEPKSIAAVIEGLREANVVPADILSWADSIRSIRNVVTHGDQPLRDDEAANVFNIMLNIVEWHLTASSALKAAGARCSRCKSPIDASWVACPSCGASLSGKCRGCDQTLQAGWKACPYCGTAA